VLLAYNMRLSPTEQGIGGRKGEEKGGVKVQSSGEGGVRRIANKTLPAIEAGEQLGD